MPNTILVTGAAGFIGSKTAERLLNAGNRVIGVDNLNDAYDRRLKDWRLARLQNCADFRFHHADISREAELRAIEGEFANASGESKPSAVINLAARAGVRQSVENPQAYIDTNVTGTLNLLDMCRRTGIKKLILASSSSLYGAQSPMPYQEDAITDQLLSPYAATKKAAETLCYTYHHLYGLDITVFRYFTVYGPAGRPDMSVFRFIQRVSEERPITIFGDGQQLRDFTYIDDIARGTILGLDLTGYQVINLGAGQPVMLMDILRLIEGALDKEAQLIHQPRHLADMNATWADTTRAQTLMGWQSETTYQQGIANTVEWYLANRDWAKDIDTD